MYTWTPTCVDKWLFGPLLLVLGHCFADLGGSPTASPPVKHSSTKVPDYLRALPGVNRGPRPVDIRESLQNNSFL